MKGLKICKECKKKILPEDKATMLMTFKGNKNLEKVYWHFDCFLLWRDRSLEIRAKELFQGSMQQSIGLLKGMMNNVK